MRRHVPLSRSKVGTPLKASSELKRSGALKRETAMRESNPARQAKRRKGNANYYASAEWRAKRKEVFVRDEYQCTETRTVRQILVAFGEEIGMNEYEMRCPNRGEIVNGKQTARGLVCEETSYRHRGIPDYIDTCLTRCKDCDRRQTPLERANWSAGRRKAS